MHGYGDHEVAEMLRSLSDWYEECQTADMFDMEYPKVPLDEEILMRLSMELATLSNND